MELIFERCCGLDVHKKTVTACIRVPDHNGKRHADIRTFSTMTEDLLTLQDWLNAYGITHVAMESTGVYWKPIYYLLEEEFDLLLVNAKHVKHVPGRKTDVSDAAWIAQLLEHGLLKSSYVPPKPIRELRDLTRYRKSLIQERTREANRLQKVLEDAGIKLSSVATDILGVSGRAMLEALINGTRDPEILSELAKGRLRAKLPQLRKALRGHFGKHHIFMVELILKHLDTLDETISACSQQISEQITPFVEAVNLLITIPGVDRRTAEVLVAEIGTDMSRFSTSGHLASWAGMCPGNNESAGKRKSGKTSPGNKWLRTALVEAARAASRTKGTYLNSQYHRLVKRRGDKKAIVAVAHSILVIVYHLLKNGSKYQDLGADFFDRRNSEKLVRRYLSGLECLGYDISGIKRIA